MFQLNDRVAIVKQRKRVGRGGSRGGTSGKGHKGQKARTGGQSKLRACFEGGQMPLYRRLPKRGFNNFNFKTEYAIINLKQLEIAFENNADITKELLVEKGLIKNTKVMIKLLATGEISKKFSITVDASSTSAIEKVQARGGQVAVVKGA